MQGTELELELRERLLIQGKTFSVNRDRKLTEEINKKIIAEMAEKSPFASMATVGTDFARKGPRRRRRTKLSNYAYYLQVMEENKFPLEMLPENTRFRKVKEIGVRMMRLVFQWQQHFNKATEDVLIMVTKDMKSMDMRQQGLEEKLDTRFAAMLEMQSQEIQRLKAAVEELTQNQRELLEKLEQQKSDRVDTGKDA
ncbi:MAG: hypothetical protein IJZ85_06925 [Lachnospiraceae bacterium]|nr:hypothetical protein [Lachnospiraceae bacterium]